MKKYSRQQLEDKALKSASLYFGRELLPYFGVGKQIRRMLPTVTVLGELIWNDGVIKGEVKGRKLNLIEMVCRKLRKGKLSAQIAEELDEDFAETERICAAAQQCAPEYDSERIYQILMAE